MMEYEVLEEQEYFLAFELAKDHGYPCGFTEFCKDFDNMINISKYERNYDEIDHINYAGGRK